MVKIQKTLIVVLTCFVLSGCAAWSAMKGLVGNGDTRDHSLHVKTTAAVGTGDANNSLVTSTVKTSYGPHAKVSNNGTTVKPISFLGFAVSQNTETILIAYGGFLTICFIIWVGCRLVFKMQKDRHSRLL